MSMTVVRSMRSLKFLSEGDSVYFELNSYQKANKKILQLRIGRTVSLQLNTSGSRWKLRCFNH